MGHLFSAQCANLHNAGRVYHGRHRLFALGKPEFSDERLFLGLTTTARPVCADFVLTFLWLQCTPSRFKFCLICTYCMPNVATLMGVKGPLWLPQPLHRHMSNPGLETYVKANMVNFSFLNFEA